MIVMLLLLLLVPSIVLLLSSPVLFFDRITDTANTATRTAPRRYCLFKETSPDAASVPDVVVGGVSEESMDDMTSWFVNVV